MIPAPSSCLTLLHRGEPAPVVLAVAGWARFLGLEARLADGRDGSPAAPGSLLVDLTSFAGDPPTTLSALAPGVDPDRILLLVRDASLATQNWLAQLTAGTVPALEEVATSGEMQFHGITWPGAKALAHTSFPREPGPSLVLSPLPGVHRLLCSAAGPIWVETVAGGSKGPLVLATKDILPPDHRTQTEHELEGRLDGVIPVLAFLRRVHGESCWHNPHHHLGLIIDDPLLIPRYGCLEWNELLAASRRVGLYVTLAFIPWNGWRTRRQEAEAFRRQSDGFGLCLHGCDHTDGEYQANDVAGLRATTAEALRRMAEHTRRTGLGAQPVMVCPQELFSRAALAALAAEPAVEAMVNSRCLPRDHIPGGITAADLLQPAFLGYHGCTVVKRFYPQKPWKIALARFLGQPTLLVEHHDYFRDGPAQLEALVSELRTAEPAYQSPALIEVVRRTHWRRVTAPGRIEIHCFTRKLEFELLGPHPTHVTIHRRLDPDSPIRGVRVDGHETPFLSDGTHLTAVLGLLSPGTHHFELQVYPAPPAPRYRRTVAQRVKIGFRRALSEFRDRIIARHQTSLAISKRIGRTLRLSR